MDLTDATRALALAYAASLTDKQYAEFQVEMTRAREQRPNQDWAALKEAPAGPWPRFAVNDKVLHNPSETVGIVTDVYPANPARELSLIVRWHGTDRLSGLLPAADFVHVTNI